MTSHLNRSRHRQSLTDVIVREVMDLVAKEGLAVGSRLPSIRAMAEQLGVAVPTMREAVQRLAIMGVTEIRHGSGVYLRNTAMPALMVNPEVDADPKTMLELLDARLTIEPELAARAAERVTPEIRGRLHSAVEAATASLTADPELHSANMDFHCVLADAAGNGILAQTLRSYTEIYSHEQMSVLQLHSLEARARDQREHRAILEAVSAGHAEAARDAMRTHLERVIVETRRQLEGGAAVD